MVTNALSVWRVYSTCHSCAYQVVRSEPLQPRTHFVSLKLLRLDLTNFSQRFLQNTVRICTCSLATKYGRLVLSLKAHSGLPKFYSTLSLLSVSLSICKMVSLYKDPLGENVFSTSMPTQQGNSSVGGDRKVPNFSLNLFHFSYSLPF